MPGKEFTVDKFKHTCSKESLPIKAKEVSVKEDDVVVEEANNIVDYEALTKPDLKQILMEKGLSFPSRASKPDLISILKGD